MSKLFKINRLRTFSVLGLVCLLAVACAVNVAFVFECTAGDTDFYASFAAPSKPPCFDPISTVDWDLWAEKLRIGVKLSEASVDADGNVTTQETFKKVQCDCDTPKGKKYGILWQVAEPIAYVEIVDKAFKSPCFNMELGSTLKMHGSTQGDSGAKRNAHYIKYFAFPVLNLIHDYLCTENSKKIDLAEISELNPVRNNPLLSVLAQPDKLAFANPLAIAAGAADCIASSFGYPINWMYYSAGCWGSLGDLTTATYGKEPVVEGARLAAQTIDWMHNAGLLHKYSEAPGLGKITDAVSKGISLALGESWCAPIWSPRIVKSQYYLNLSWPYAGKAVPIGDFGIKWALNKTSPGNEDYVYTVWRIRHCCQGITVNDAVNVGTKVVK